MACKVINVMPIICIANSIFSLVCVSWERYRAIALCLISPNSHTSVKVGISMSWVIAIIAATPTAVEYDIYSSVQGNETLIGCGSMNFLPTYYGIVNGFFVLSVTYIIPIIVITTNYSRLVKFIWKKAKVHPSADNEVTNGGRQKNSGAGVVSQVSKSKVKLVKMLIILAVLFAASWMPYFILLIIAVCFKNSILNILILF